MSKTYDTGIEPAWEYKRIVDWHPNRHPARWLLGPCPQCGRSTSSYGGGYSCHDDCCRNSANVFARSTPDPTPDWWDMDIDVKLDGNAWCATGRGFINLQESHAGFGDTPREAVAALLLIQSSETPEAKAFREAKESEAERASNIQRLKSEIAGLQERINALLTPQTHPQP